MLLGLTALPTRTIDYQKLQYQAWDAFFHMVGRVVQVTPHMIEIIDVALSRLLGVKAPVAEDRT